MSSSKSFVGNEMELEIMLREISLTQEANITCFLSYVEFWKAWKQTCQWLRSILEGGGKYYQHTLYSYKKYQNETNLLYNKYTRIKS